MSKSVAFALMLPALAACGPPKLRPIAAPSAVAGGPAITEHLPASGAYHLDPAQSEVRVLVYRAGPLSSLGHNHVLVNRHLTGAVVVGAAWSGSSFTISAPSSEFVVDDVRARLEEGVDFPNDLSEDARAGTLHNMLSAAVLDAAAFPTIMLRGVGGIKAGVEVVKLDVDIAGHASSLVLPVTWHSAAGVITAEDSVTLKQTALGLTPYSLMLGALQVQDAMQVKYRLVAVGDP